MSDKEKIRNFCIIAHIDHGKSTLADRFLEMAGVIKKLESQSQVLDNMELERERGITIKAKAVRLNYSFEGKDYILNLIDTPGHVDFTYEVAKSLKAAEGAILLVDASEGIEAQTVANFYLALENDLKILPVINKIDLPAADTERVLRQLNEVFGFKRDEVSLISAKNGTGIADLMRRIVKEIPPPGGSDNAPLKALLFDSSYDIYQGVVLFLRVFEGFISPGEEILLMHQNKRYRVEEVGYFLPSPERGEKLTCGEVGYIYCNIKDPSDVDIGDTVTSVSQPTAQPFEGYKKLLPMVFCGIFPAFPKDYNSLREAIEKLKLSDASFTYEPDNLGSLGYGFRCGFLGLLHMEVIQERLKREYGLELILTSPNVKYKIQKKGKSQLEDIESAYKFPDPSTIEKIYEPFVKATIVTPLEGMDPLCDLAKSRRGEFIKMDYLGQDRLSLVFSLPLSEIMVDFYNKIKSLTRGYGSFDYEFSGYQESDIVKLDIFFNKKRVDAFSILIHRQKAETKGRAIVEHLKNLIPRQMYEISIQAGIGTKIIASSKIPALRKNVTAKCYGGDITRKRKLWEKQKKGKKKMKQFGNIALPDNIFLEVLKM